MPKVRETTITKKVLVYLNALPGCRAEKRHGSRYGRVGAPDITGCLHGWRFELEVKRPGEKLSPIQAHELHKWALAGAATGVVHSLEEAQAFIGQHSPEPTLVKNIIERCACGLRKAPRYRRPRRNPISAGVGGSGFRVGQVNARESAPSARVPTGIGHTSSDGKVQPPKRLNDDQPS